MILASMPGDKRVEHIRHDLPRRRISVCFTARRFHIPGHGTFAKNPCEYEP
jgi:hypothetical protein